MSNRDWEPLRKALEEQAGSLESQIARKMGEVHGNDRTEAANLGDRIDQAEVTTEMRRDLAEAQRDIDELNQVRRALARMDDESYGFCTDCGTMIPIERLEVEPFAERCLPCQEIFERKHRF